MARRMSILKQPNSGQTPTKSVRFETQYPDFEIDDAVREFLTTKLVDRRMQQILSIFNSDDSDDVVINACLLAFTNDILLIDKTFEPFIRDFLKIKWCKRSDSVIRSYHNFILNLITANNYFVPLVLRSHIMEFMPSMEDGADPDSGAMNSRDIAKFKDCHTIISSIVQLLPLSKQIVMQLISECFPHFTRKPREQAGYLLNVLHMTAYLQNRREILKIVFTQLVKLDVAFMKEDVEYEEFSEDEEAMDCDEKDGIDNNSDDSSDPFNFVSRAALQGIPCENVTANKLDILLVTFVEYCRKVCGELDMKEPERCSAIRELYSDLQYIFYYIILPTYNCSYVQFVLFYFCGEFGCQTEGNQRKRNLPALADNFLSFLWKQVRNVSSSGNVRCHAVSYLSGMLARASYIPLSAIKSYISDMASWASQYLEVSAKSDGSAVFFAVCQALFYLIVFHYKHFSDDEGIKFLQTLNLNRLIQCRLNPLRVISQTVATAFSNITERHQLAYCKSVMTKNARQCLPVAMVSASSAKMCTELQDGSRYLTVFPYDSCEIPRFRKYVMQYYREYEPSPLEQSIQNERNSVSESIDIGVKDLDVTANDDDLLSILVLSTSPSAPHQIYHEKQLCLN